METVGISMGSYLDDLSTKRKVSKRKNQRQKSIDYSTIGRVSQQAPDSKTDRHMTKEQMAKGELEDLERSKRALLNAEIDEFLDSLIRDGMTNEAYRGYVAKSIYTLGLQKVNELRIKALNGKSPQHLFNSKIKGALELHRKNGGQG